MALSRFSDVRFESRAEEDGQQPLSKARAELVLHIFAFDEAVDTSLLNWHPQTLRQLRFQNNLLSNQAMANSNTCCFTPQ